MTARNPEIPYHESFVPHEWFHVDFQTGNVKLPDDSLTHLSRDQMRILITSRTEAKNIDDIVRQVYAMRYFDDMVNIDVTPRSPLNPSIIRAKISLINQAFGVQIITHGNVSKNYQIISKEEWETQVLFKKNEAAQLPFLLKNAS